MVRIAIIGDTHIPSRADRIPKWIREEVEAADHTIHVGDFDAADTLAEVRDFAGGELTAVTGNMDPRLDLPSVTTVERGGVEFVVTHGTGDIEGYEERVAGVVSEEASDGPTVGVSGHTHQMLDAETDGVRLLNPGSATGAEPAETATMMTAETADGDIDVTIHEG
ncbi:metallophosphoesterase family protein [Halococcus saccharolyticus]|uniref:Phosphoesterase n=1 Tax=Halococcus saccharolyticus DSM 5350 TaxID=1227455 RepID=M0MKP1_9EURY|nr:metallophosphoesterase family protein [Halococcus saccharolyticus]EMA45309.1 phosphodiesterase, MJ0936 family protein [Halococcus saccharolyticus DSM 5350]